jgi:hypothetical protein
MNSRRRVDQTFGRDLRQFGRASAPMMPQRMHTMCGLTPEPARIRVSCCGRAEAISRDASSPDSILPICSGGIDASWAGTHRDQMGWEGLV